jgi:hypothetical protein
MSEPHLDWSNAEVRDAKLTVSLEGEQPRGWKDTFEKTAELIGNGEWDTVKVKKQSVRVEGVRAGSEDKLRHFLESVVQQANATHQTEPDEPETDAGEPDEQAEEPEGDTKSDDSEMTERFRSFAGT